MTTLTQILYLWLPILVAIGAIIVVCLAVSGGKSQTHKSKQTTVREAKQQRATEPEQNYTPSIKPTAPAYQSAKPTPRSAIFQVRYVTFDNSEYPPLLSLQGDLTVGSLTTGDYVRNIDRTEKVRINCMSDYGNHIADTLTKIEDAVILVECDDPEYIHQGDTLVKD